MNPNFRNFALWAIIALLLIALFNMFQSPSERTAGRDIAYSQFLKDVDAGRVRDVTIVGERISGNYTDSATGFQTYSPGDAGLIDRLNNRNVSITARPEVDSSNTLVGYLISWLPILLILGAFMDQIAILILTVPVFLPLVKALGFDPIWFGVIFVVTAEVGMVTPPMGMNVFVVSRYTGRPVTEVFHGTFPHIIAHIIIIALLTAFPAIILWLPGTM